MRADVRELVAFYKELAGDGIIDDLLQVIQGLPHPQSICRALVAWIDFLDTLIQESEKTHGPGKGSRKTQEVKASVLYVLEKSRFDLVGIPRFIQPLLFDACVDWSCEWIVELLNRHQLWETGAPSEQERLGLLQSILVSIDAQIQGFRDQLYALAWWAARARHPLPPGLRVKLDALVETMPLDAQSMMGSTASALEWMGTHRRQISQFLQIIAKAVRDAENFIAMSGSQKKQYVRDMVLTFLDETGLLPAKSAMAYGFAAIMIDAGIDAVVHIFNKHSLFKHGIPALARETVPAPTVREPVPALSRPPARLAPPVLQPAIPPKEPTMSNDRRVAFIISGAGALIAQELAMAKTLLEGLHPGGSRIRPTVLTGASSGCLSSVLLSGILQSAERGGSFTWDALQNEVIFPLQNKNIYKTGLFQGLIDIKHAFWDGYVLDTRPLHNTLKKYINGTKYLNYHLLRDLYVPTYISAIHRQDGLTKRFFSGNPNDASLNLVQVMLASTAIPVAFPERTIDTTEGTWVDGSVGSDLTPVAPLVNQEPFDEVYVITPQFRMPATGPAHWGKGVKGKRSLLDNMLFGLEVQFNSMIDMQLFAAVSVVKDPNKAFLYRPDLPQAFGFLDFGVMEKQFNATMEWTRANSPRSIYQYLIDIKQIPPNGAPAPATQSNTTASSSRRPAARAASAAAGA